MLNSSPTATLPELLAACVAAAVHAGRVIREVVAAGADLAVVNKADGAYDPQTVADRRAQQRMMHALRRAFPALRIVGEEGELEPPEARDRVDCDLPAAALPALDVPAELRALDWSELVLWMDPLDGTKRFAAAKYDEVSVLLGLSYRKRAVAGVVHLPFAGKSGATYWGGPGMGVFLAAHADGPAHTTGHVRVPRPTSGFPRRPLTATVSSTNCDLVNSALRALAPGEVRTGGATGTMVLGVVTGASDMFLRFKNATRKWDICAVEPLLVALGGALVDAQDGKPYDYDADEDPTFDNPRGLLACLDAQLLASTLKVMADVRVAR